MANVKISELPLTTAVTGADVVPIVQSGLTKQVSFSSVLTSPTLFASGMATFLATPSSANLRAVLSDETGTGSAVFATSPTLVTPDLGTPSAGTLTNCTGLPASALTGAVPVANGGTNLTTFPALSIPVASTLNTLSALTVTANQSVRVNSGGTAWEAYTPSTGDVTLTGTQTLTNKTLTDPAIIGTILEDVYTISDGAAFEVDPGNGSVQLITLGANRTPKATNFAAGEAITLMVDDGSAYTITWSDSTWGGSGVVWKTDNGNAPTLNTSGYTVIVLWKVGTQVYGARVGNA